MNSGEAAGITPAKDISAAQVWIACGLLLAILVTIGVINPAILQGPPTRLGRNHELGLLETVQNILLLVSLIITLATLLRAKSNLLRAWLILIAFGTFFLLGEEISWGQHYFNWETGGWFAANNDQYETNLHNTKDGWLDQKPRAILLFGMILGTIVHPLVKHFRGRGLFDNPWWLAPTLASLAPVVISQVASLPETLDDLNFMAFSMQEFFGYRSSEMEEVFLYAFFITYTLSLGRRLKERPDT